MFNANHKINLQNMRKQRVSAGYTQKQMAEILGLKTVSAYSKKESGESPITLIEGFIIAETFGKTIDNIFLRSNFPDKTETEKNTA